MNGWMVTVCGYALAGGEWSTFPWIWSIFIFVPLSLAANFIDLKDIAGDKATGLRRCRCSLASGMHAC